jgi:hypothetical protein
MGNVIDIFSRKIMKEKALSPKLKESFNNLMLINKANQDRLRKEREQANKNVIKSYKIK